MKGVRYKIVLLLSLLSLPAMLLVATGGAGDGGSAEERYERSNGCRYLIKPRDI